MTPKLQTVLLGIGSALLVIGVLTLAVMVWLQPPIVTRASTHQFPPLTCADLSKGPPVCATDTSATLPPPPEIATVTPSQGPTTGGTTVVLTGGPFEKVTAVFFGATNAQSFGVLSNSRMLVVTVPAHLAGTVNVRVITVHGASTATERSTYTYVSERSL